MAAAPREVDIEECLNSVNSTINLFLSELGEIQNLSSIVTPSGSVKQNEEGIIEFLSKSITSLEKDKRKLEKTIRKLRDKKEKVSKVRKTRKKRTKSKK